MSQAITKPRPGLAAKRRKRRKKDGASWERTHPPKQKSTELGLFICTPRVSMRCPASVAASVSDDSAGMCRYGPHYRRQPTQRGGPEVSTTILRTKYPVGRAGPDPYFCPDSSVVNPPPSAHPREVPFFYPLDCDNYYIAPLSRKRVTIVQKHVRKRVT